MTAWRSKSGAATGVPGQIWTRPEAMSCDGDPLVELADGENEAAVLVEEGGGPGEFEGVIV